MRVCLELVLGLVMEAQDCEVVTVLEEGQGEVRLPSWGRRFLPNHLRLPNRDLRNELKLLTKGVRRKWRTG